MLIECKCGKEFLTEADAYVVLPLLEVGAEFNCGCHFKKEIDGAMRQLGKCYGFTKEKNAKIKDLKFMNESLVALNNKIILRTETEVTLLRKLKQYECLAHNALSVIEDYKKLTS